MALYSLSQKIVSLVLAISFLASVVSAIVIPFTSAKVVARQNLLAPLILSPQLRATAGDPFHVYGVDFGTVTEWAVVRLDDTIIGGLFKTDEQNPIETTAPIPPGTAGGFHTMTLICDNNSASMDVEVCSKNGTGCEPAIGILVSAAQYGLPGSIVVTGPNRNFPPAASFNIVGNGFQARSLSLSVDDGAHFLGNVVADSMGNFESQQFTMPLTLPYGGHHITAIQILGCDFPFCLHTESKAETPFNIVSNNPP